MSVTLKKISQNSNSETNSCRYDNRIITKKAIEYYEKMLIMAEKETQTIKKYIRDVKKLMIYANGRSISKELLLKYKEYLEKCGNYKISSINSYLAAANNFCDVMGWTDIRVKMIKVQHETFIPENKELTMQEYEKLVKTAYRKGDIRLAFIMEKLGRTGYG